MVLNRGSKGLPVACLLLTCFQAAATNSATHSGKACALDETKMQQLQQFDKSDELDFSPSNALSMMQKRAEEGATATHNAEKLDTTYQRKGGSTKEAFKSKIRNTPWTWTEPWTTRWPGCCEGERSPDNGKLFGGNMTSLAACKQKCRTFRNCGSVEYGWKDGNTQWCFIWADTQTCEKRDRSCTKSVPGNGRGVANYLYTAPQITEDDLAMAKWSVVGSGCCAGLRDESNGKLYADKEKNLDACKARCLSFHNCGLVEYGWQAGDPQWCYIWANSQTCGKIDPDCTESVLNSGVGAQIHRYSKVVATEPDGERARRRKVSTSIDPLATGAPTVKTTGAPTVNTSVGPLATGAPTVKTTGAPTVNTSIGPLATGASTSAAPLAPPTDDASVINASALNMSNFNISVANASSTSSTQTMR